MIVPRKLQEMGIQICASMVWFSINTDVCDVPSKHLRWHSNEDVVIDWKCVLSSKRASQKHFVRWISFYSSTTPALTFTLSTRLSGRLFGCVCCTNIYLYLTHNAYRQIDTALNWCQIYGLYYEFNVLKMWMIILEYARVRMLFSRLTVYSCYKCGTYARIYMNRHTHASADIRTIDEANGNIYGKLNAYSELNANFKVHLLSVSLIALALALSLSFYPFFCFVNFLNANMRMSVYIYSPTHTWIARKCFQGQL